MPRQPSSEGRIDPFDDGYALAVLLIEARCEPWQRFVMEDPIAKRSNLIQSAGDASSASFIARASRKREAQMLPQLVLVACIE